MRDAQFRGNSALETIRCWPSVRRGEERDIFRLQEEADIMFNSALVYELAVIKRQAEFLLNQIDRSQPEYIDARRLLSFLSFFLPLEPSGVPPIPFCANLSANPVSLKLNLPSPGLKG